MPPLLSGFVCDYHLAALGSSPKHTILTFIMVGFDAFIVKYVLYLSCGTNENKQKKPGLAHFLRKNSISSNGLCFVKAFELNWSKINWPKEYFQSKKWKLLIFKLTCLKENNIFCIYSIFILYIYAWYLYIYIIICI